MKTLNVPEGGTIRYRDVGDGFPIICIHGWGASGEFLDGTVASLSSRFRILVPNLRGHAGSSPFAEGTSFSQLGDDIDALIRKENLDRVVLLGWSLGAMVAWDYLDRYGDARIAGLIVIEMVPRLLNDEQWSHGLREGRDELVFGRSLAAMRADWNAFTGVFIPRVFAPDASAERIAEGRELAGRNDPESMARLWSALVTQDHRETVTKIRVPTLIIHGARSQLYEREASRWLADRIAGARLECFEHSGHAPHLEEPERFEKLVDEFVAGLHQPESQPAATKQN